MRSYLDRLLAYLPAHVARARLGDPSRREEWGEHVLATVLVADFSGFTALSEALGAHGEKGALELTDILNRYFRMLLEEVAFLRGGDLTKFGGDGFILVFLGDDHARQAAAAALEIQEAMRLFPVVETIAGEFPIALRVGLHTGTVFEGVVGVPEAPEYMIGGSEVERAVAIEEAAPVGGVALSPDAIAAVGEGARTRPGPEGLLVLEELEPRPPRSGPAAGAGPEAGDVEASIALLEPLLPARVAARMRSETDGPALPAVYRPATALFVVASGLPFDGPGDIVPVMGHIGGALTTLLSALGSPVRKTDVCADGLKLVLLFGPPDADGPEIGAAATAAVLLRRGLMPPGATSAKPGSGPVLRMGLATGPVFAGEVGSPHRCEYTAIGDVMNTAARLSSQAAPWEILATEPVAAAVAKMLPTEDAGARRLKGKQDAVACRRLLDPGVAPGAAGW